MTSSIQFTYEFDPIQIKRICNHYHSEQLMYYTVFDSDKYPIMWAYVKHLYIEEVFDALKISREDLKKYNLNFSVSIMFEDDFVMALKRFKMIHIQNGYPVRFSISYNDVEEYNAFKNKMKLKNINLEELAGYQDYQGYVDMKFI